MNAVEINFELAKAIERLEKAQPGSGTMETRAANRSMASAMIEALPKNWFRKADDALIARLTELA